MIPSFSKKYLSDSELETLKRNRKYRQWALQSRCPVCDGDGSEPGRYRLLGKEYECPQDDYGHVMIQLAKLYWLHNIPYQYQILPPFNGPQRVEMRETLDRYIENFRALQKTGVGLTFYSKINGTGKTWAATYVLKELVKQGWDGWFAPFYEVQGYFEIDDPSERAFRVNRVQEAGILVLDEVMQPISNAQGAHFANQLERLIRPRQDANFPTIITTNLTLEELEHYYPRVFSLLSAKNIEFPMPDGEDARKSDDLFNQNIEVALNGEAWPIT